ncbi:hypothetical protein BGP34_03575 [Bacillus mycoides]|nr:hypothetical protein TU70_08365 [Bacillus mycoides]OOR59901.1 hypothetical protein BGP34_03575 [Bacillus mycoides]TXR81856.1 hypothetical protein DN408_12570 [Bacillus sp. AR13-1]
MFIIELLSFLFTPLFAGSKNPTSKFGECEEVRREIIARLVWANNQWEWVKPPLIKVSLYMCEIII